MSNPRILAFAGSTRKESFNRKLLTVAVELARQADLDVEHIELADFPLPFMDEDLEAERGQPENATALRRLMLDADAFMLACPEYNSSITPLMKNVIDWCSRKESGGGDLSPYSDKNALLLGASPGRSGGKRSVETVRSILGNIGVEVFDKEFTLPGAGDAFDDLGQLRDVEMVDALKAIVKAFSDSIR
ncbi:MAG: FMN reductase [Xanthomonadales bacterium]|nr:FMN reductase [Xanthomonadales bacterium]MBL37713.1 FMN reductase [Xanthomonadales bacterium]|tara:strand:+ start:1176 stop:1742 length:567 start_codon:yes stop_codon:yes gene_type:complete